MLARLKEAVLPRIIGAMVHTRERLTLKEQAAQKNFLAKLAVPKRKTDRPLIVAIIGLIGSGKSSVAKELAGHIGATVIEGDAIRVELRKQSERYERARAIAENVALEVIKRGGSVILDSDFVDEKKRASLREKARKEGVRLIFIRTYCDLDVVVGRVLAGKYHDSPDDFFGGATSKWNGSEQSKGAAVKGREMWRRTPHHYRWVNQVGGKWILKKLPFTVFAEIDTADESEWKREVQKCAKRLIAL